MKKIFKSLRSRIILCLLVAGILPVFLLHVIVVNTYESSLIQTRTIEIKQRCLMITSQLGEHESIQDSLTEEMKRVLNWYSEAYGGRLVVVNPRYEIVLDTFYADTGKITVSDAIFIAFSGKEYESYQEDNHYLEYVLPITFSEGNDKSILGVLVFSSTTDWIADSLYRVKKAMWLVETILVFLIVIVGIYVSHLLLRPVENLSYRFDRTKEGKIDAETPKLSSYTEIDRLLSSSNTIIENYKKSEESREQFVSNVSHELRTPMTSIRVLAESLIGQKNVPEEMYQEFLNDISTEIDRETRIIDDLLSMSRLGAAEAMHIEEVFINDFLLEILNSVRPIATKRKIEVVFESFRKIYADIDRVKLSQAFLNLIENAIKYTNDGGHVKVSADADHEYFYVQIADTGVGIPEEAIPHIFDRFYRVDKARSRETGGTGLGLSITKQIVLLHYGIIKVESEMNVGSTFTVRIPLKHVDHPGGWKS